MALKEKITQEDLILYEILKNPVLCTEFIYSVDLLEHEEEFIYDWYQQDFMCDFNAYVSLSCGRSVGKSQALVGIIIWLLVNNVFPLEYFVYTVPGQAHLEPIWSKLIRYFRSNSFLKTFISPRGGVNASEHSIRLINNTHLICRIAGQSGTGANVIGLHTPFVMLDESGYYPWGTWVEMQPILNTFTPGFRLIVSGVPTGLRENNVNWHCDQENSSYMKHKISALQNPRFTDEDRLKAVKQYGGEDTDDYIHLVLGQHGKPVFALFDRAAMLIENYPVHKLTLDGTKLFDNIGEYITKLNIFPGLPHKNSKCIFGIDLGYTEPTVIIVMLLESSGHMKFHGRITMEKVNYFIQEKIIDILDSRFQPMIIGIDEGAAGKAVIPRMQESQEFANKNYKERLIPINFSSQVVIGVDHEEKEIKTKTKPFSVGVLQEYTNNHKIIYSTTDLELITELERMTYAKTLTGDVVYRTLTEKGGQAGPDHMTSALLCGSLAYYLNIEDLNFSKRYTKLVSPFWNR